MAYSNDSQDITRELLVEEQNANSSIYADHRGIQLEPELQLGEGVAFFWLYRRAEYLVLLSQAGTLTLPTSAYQGISSSEVYEDEAAAQQAQETMTFIWPAFGLVLHVTHTQEGMVLQFYFPSVVYIVKWTNEDV